LSTQVVTYSPAYTVVPTYECFNRCTYCNFRVEPGTDNWMSLQQAESQLKQLQNRGIIEILILSGEVHPLSARRQEWFHRIYHLCELALSLGFLPHTNAGPLSFTEMSQLKTVNVSMGLMLEQVTPELLKTVHRHAPSKVPSLRLQQLEWAGELRIPFTTGLLLGIGETVADRLQTLEAIAQTHQRWGHIQEVILQPHRPGHQQSWQGDAFEMEQLLETVAIAREILPPDITLQIPPNLIPDADRLIACIEAGARDLGGIGPKDEVNPDYPHPHDAALSQTLAEAGWQLLPRLPIYSQHDNWLSAPLQLAVQRWRNGLVSR
jgi:7,8-didemethyl-8-hydroxy-5-deazariboflavin synthase